jgi:hypothetical protein
MGKLIRLISIVAGAALLWNMFMEKRQKRNRFFNKKLSTASKWTNRLPQIASQMVSLMPTKNVIGLAQPFVGRILNRGIGRLLRK